MIYNLSISRKNSFFSKFFYRKNAAKFKFRVKKISQGCKLSNIQILKTE